MIGHAYPSLRQLTVLERLGDHGVTTSICAKKVATDGSPQSDPDFGYNPALTALIERLRPVFAK